MRVRLSPALRRALSRPRKLFVHFSSSSPGLIVLSCHSLPAKSVLPDAFNPQYRAILESRRNVQGTPQTPRAHGTDASQSQRAPVRTASPAHSLLDSTLPRPSSARLELPTDTPTPRGRTLALRAPTTRAPPVQSLPAPIGIRTHPHEHDLHDIDEVDEEHLEDMYMGLAGLQDDDVAITKQSLSGRQRGRMPEVRPCSNLTFGCTDRVHASLDGGHRLR